MSATLAPPPVRMRTLSSPSSVPEAPKAALLQSQSPFSTISRAFKWSSNSIGRKGGRKNSTAKQLRTAASCNNLLDSTSRVDEAQANVDVVPENDVVGPLLVPSSTFDVVDRALEEPIKWPKRPNCFTSGFRVRAELKQPIFTTRVQERTLLSRLTSYIIPDSSNPAVDYTVHHDQHAFQSEAPYPLTYCSEALRRYSGPNQSTYSPNADPYFASVIVTL